MISLFDNFKHFNFGIHKNAFVYISKIDNKYPHIRTGDYLICRENLNHKIIQYGCLYLIQVGNEILLGILRRSIYPNTVLFEELGKCKNNIEIQKEKIISIALVIANIRGYHIF